jgi:hypothetical protein
LYFSLTAKCRSTLILCNALSLRSVGGSKKLITLCFRQTLLIDSNLFLLSFSACKKRFNDNTFEIIQYIFFHAWLWLLSMYHYLVFIFQVFCIHISNTKHHIYYEVFFSQHLSIYNDDHERTIHVIFWFYFKINIEPAV